MISNKQARTYISDLMSKDSPIPSSDSPKGIARTLNFESPSLLNSSGKKSSKKEKNRSAKGKKGSGRIGLGKSWRSLF